MTLWEFAIARHFGQLLAESETRELTAKETERLEVLGRRVEAYEAREMRRGNTAGRGSSKKDLDTRSSSGVQRPAVQALV
jgi:hypothetical protein